jgi:hypothetical protein
VTPATSEAEKTTARRATAGDVVTRSADLLRVAAAAVWVELRRRRLAPARVVSLARERGRARRQRTNEERLSLQRLISLFDRCFPGGANCYRRTLIEMALDRDAAAEPLSFGLRRAGGVGSGHAWLGSSRDPRDRYDAEFVV